MIKNKNLRLEIIRNPTQHQFALYVNSSSPRQSYTTTPPQSLTTPPQYVPPSLFASYSSSAGAVSVKVAGEFVGWGGAAQSGKASFAKTSPMANMKGRLRKVNLVVN
jgi:hypothetical protein